MRSGFSDCRLALENEISKSCSSNYFVKTICSILFDSGYFTCMSMSMSMSISTTQGQSAAMKSEQCIAMKPMIGLFRDPSIFIASNEEHRYKDKMVANIKLQ